MDLELSIILQKQKNEYNINADKSLTKYIEAMYVSETEKTKQLKCPCKRKYLRSLKLRK